MPSWLSPIPPKELTSPTGRKWYVYHPPPTLERVRKRFSESNVSISNLSNLKFSQGEFSGLSNRTNAFSKWNVSPSAMEGSTEKEMFLYNVPAVQISRPERSNP